MSIQIKSRIQGAREAEGIAIIIDVIRASSTIVAALVKGAEGVVPVAEVDEALKLRKENPDWILASDFDEIRKENYDNSPTALSNLDLTGRKVILKTVNGTRGILNAKKADEIWVGSFLNVGSIVEGLKNHDTVTLVPMGELEGPAPEDEGCARLIKDRLEGRPVDFSLIKQESMTGFAAKHLIKTNRKADLDFCLQFNKFNIIPKVFKIGEKLLIKPLEKTFKSSSMR